MLSPRLRKICHWYMNDYFIIIRYLIRNNVVVWWMKNLQNHQQMRSSVLLQILLYTVGWLLLLFFLLPTESIWWESKVKEMKWPWLAIPDHKEPIKEHTDIVSVWTVHKSQDTTTTIKTTTTKTTKARLTQGQNVVTSKWWHGPKTHQLQPQLPTMTS